VDGSFGRDQGSPRIVMAKEEEEERRADFFFISFDTLLRYTGLGL
jgi:hypothetical protein